MARYDDRYSTRDREPDYDRGQWGREWRSSDDDEQQRYRQREPYGAGGSSYGSEDYYGRYRSEAQRGGASRYSESQYGSEGGRGREREQEGRRYPGSGQRGREYGGRESSGGSERFGADRDRRIGSESRRFEGPFSDYERDPGYFGTGYYGDGGPSPTGGYDQRWGMRGYGSLSRDTMRSESDSPRWGGGESRRNEQSWGGGSQSWGGGQQSRGGYGGYGQQQQQRRYRTGPKGYTRSDDRLREDISERLMMADHIDSSEVSVNVKDGKVTLEGTVSDRYMKHSIEDLVDMCPGVQDIDNRIRVERSTGEGESSQQESRYGQQSGSTQQGASSGQQSGAGQRGSTGVGSGIGTSSMGSGASSGTSGTSGSDKSRKQ